MFFYHVILPYAYLQFTLSITFTYFWYYVNIGYIKTRPNVKFSLYLKKAGLAPGGGDSHMEWTGMLVGNFEFKP